VIGLGNKLSVRQTITLSTQTTQKDKSWLMCRRGRPTCAATAEPFLGHVVHFQVQNDQIRLKPPRQFEPLLRATRRQRSHSAAFQCRLQHFPRLFRLIDDQYAAWPVQGDTLRGESGRRILAPTEG
jgi:hypothetical protein